MADEQTDQQTENKPDDKPEEKREERREDSPKREDTPEPKRDEEPAKLCTKCYTRVPLDHFGSHMYHAHGVERRATKERKDDQDDAESPTPKRRKDTPTKDENGTQKPARRKSRWSEVRSGWGG